MSYPFRNLVFEGGGVKGIAYVGAMQVLESESILENISRVGGTSAGSINAVLFAAGFSNTEMLKVLKRLDFNDFKDDSWLALRDMRRLKDEYGWYKGDYFRDWIGDLLKQKTGSANVTFKALHEHTGKELYVYASNLSTKFGEVYSPEHTVVVKCFRPPSFELSSRPVLPHSAAIRRCVYEAAVRCNNRSYSP